MKLQNLISICHKDWLDGFTHGLEERGAQKSVTVVKSIRLEEEESSILKMVYGSDSEKSKKSFNQLASSLYKELLSFLLKEFRSYPDELIAGLRQELAAGNEQEFLRQADIIERVLSDVEAIDHLVGFYHLMQDHHFQNKYMASVYAGYTSKLRSTIDQVSDYASIEEYYLKNDLGGRKKKPTKGKSTLDPHFQFYSKFFGKEHPDRTRIRSRLFWLKTVKLNEYFNLASEDAQTIANEAFSILGKRPYLYFNLAEIETFSNISYQLYTGYDHIEPKRVQALINDFFEMFDDEWMIQLYPRVVQALITTQARYYGGRAGFRFVDDPTPMDPDIEKGLNGLIPMVVKIRERPNLIEEGNRFYGLETEALSRMHLPGENRFIAIKLFEQLKLQEQQMQNVMGAHMIHANLMHCFLWAKQWPELIEEVEKYRRLVKSKGQLSDILMRITDFSELIAKQMLGEISLSGDELWKKCEALLQDHPRWFDDMVPYVFDQLGFERSES